MQKKKLPTKNKPQYLHLPSPHSRCWVCHKSKQHSGAKTGAKCPERIDGVSHCVETIGGSVWPTFKNTSPRSSISKPPSSSRTDLVLPLMWIRRAEEHDTRWEASILWAHGPFTLPSIFGTYRIKMVRIPKKWLGSGVCRITNYKVGRGGGSQYLREKTVPRNVRPELYSPADLLRWIPFLRPCWRCLQTNNSEASCCRPRPPPQDLRTTANT